MTAAFPIIMAWLAINAAVLAIGCARWARIEAEEYLRRADRARRFRRAMDRIGRTVQQ